MAFHIKQYFRENKKLRKTLLILGLVLVCIPILVIIFISPITKYFIEKYDVQFTGRQIEMSRAYVNPFTGYVHFSDIKMLESESDSIFFSAEGMSLNVSMHKLFSKTYEITQLDLDQPRFSIIQEKKILNFSDLIEKFTPKGPRDTTKAPVQFNVLDINLKEGKVYFRDKLIPINYFVQNVNIHSPGIRWNSDTIATEFSFESGMGSGRMQGDFAINTSNKDYKMSVVVTKFDLNIIEQYLKDLTNYGTFSAFLDADLKSSGTFEKVENVTTSGSIVISDFHFGKNPNDDYASFEKLAIAINVISPKLKKFHYDSISLTKPFFKYEKYDSLDNLQTIFGQNGSNLKEADNSEAQFNLIIEIADYIRELSKNFFRSHYRVNKFAIYDGNIKYNDFSTAEKFSIGMSPLTILADSIDKDNIRVHVKLLTGIKPYGSGSVYLSINPKDSSDFDLNYHLQNIPVTMFNPYIISQTSFPFDRGSVELEGSWRVRNADIKSDNHLIIVDPRITERIRNKEVKWLPMRLIMAFVRERGNVIDYEVPISGNLNDPKFHLRDVIVDVLKNIFVKPATTTYRMQVKNTEIEIEKSLTLTWDMRNSTLNSKQEKFVERMAEFLEKTPNASISIVPQVYSLKEKEYILFFEAKKKYYLMTNKMNEQSLSESDFENIDKMSVKDDQFVKHLNKVLKDSMMFTIQEKCSSYISSSIVDSEYKNLNEKRKNTFINYFKKENVESRLKIAQANTVIPYNGFSFYKIEYKGELPKSLLNAYNDMNQLNNESPRRKYKTVRLKNKELL
ncbi:MAG: DUF748 domain-containing protein [Bacteroidia bacterium]|jgi:hypothetical protein|nr:DUF748 domain-containing protein [Bacteroidia bacterium]